METEKLQDVIVYVIFGFPLGVLIYQVAINGYLWVWIPHSIIQFTCCILNKLFNLSDSYFVIWIWRW